MIHELNIRNFGHLKAYCSRNYLGKELLPDKDQLVNTLAVTYGAPLGRYVYLLNGDMIVFLKNSRFVNAFTGRDWGVGIPPSKHQHVLTNGTTIDAYYPIEIRVDNLGGGKVSQLIDGFQNPVFIFYQGVLYKSAYLEPFGFGRIGMSVFDPEEAKN